MSEKETTGRKLIRLIELIEKAGYEAIGIEEVSPVSETYEITFRKPIQRNLNEAIHNQVSDHITVRTPKVLINEKPIEKSVRLPSEIVKGRQIDE